MPVVKGLQHRLALGFALLLTTNLCGSQQPLTHFALIPMRLQTDGLGGHVLRALPPLDLALALGLQPVCHGNLLYNGKMPDAPHASGMLMGCGASAHAGGDWASREDVEGLPRVNVTWCDAAAAVKAATESTVFILQPANYRDLKGIDFGAKAASWLRKQYHRIRRADPARVAASKAAWGSDSESGGRVAVHYRSGSWSLQPHYRTFRSRFKGHTSQVDFFVEQLDRDRQLTRLVVLGASIEVDAAQQQAKQDMDRLQQRYQNKAAVYMSPQALSEQVETVARDLDVLTTADWLLVGRGQFGATACLLQETGRVHLFEHPGAMLVAAPRLPNTRVLRQSRQGKEEGIQRLLITAEEAAQAAAPMLNEATVAKLRIAFPNAACTAVPPSRREPDGGAKTKVGLAKKTEL